MILKYVNFITHVFACLLCGSFSNAASSSNYTAASRGAISE
jgi:hypothetical protein